jgi:hypothetical protein
MKVVGMTGGVAAIGAVCRQRGGEAAAVGDLATLGLEAAYEGV